MWGTIELVYGEREPRDKIERDFVAYNAANPEVYEWFDECAKEAIAVGKTWASIRLFTHALRWRHYIGTTDTSSNYYVNNNYTPLYARLWMERNPEHMGFFETRVRKSEKESLLGFMR